MEGLQVDVDDEHFLATDENLIGDSTIDPRRKGDFLRLGDGVLRE